MIVSHRYRYVFVELPRTGSTAIDQELRDLYDGARVGAKHGSYEEFLRTATDDEKTYFVFSCIRDPIDDAVSRYFKLKTDHEQRYSHPVKSRYQVGLKRAETMLHDGPPDDKKIHRRRLGDRLENRRFRWIRDHDADFPTYFLHYYHLPYDNWSRLSHHRLDYVIRFEHLEEDFDAVLHKLGIEPVRPLPVRNRTSGKDRASWEYYGTPAAIRRARRVFGPYMQRWGYELPSAWGDGGPSAWDRTLFTVASVPRTFYWRVLRGRV